MPDQALLRYAAQCAGTNPFFLASLLLAYARAEGLDDPALAHYLGCAPADLPALLLCRRPAADPATFRAEVQRVAERFQLDPGRLAEAIRLAESLEALRRPSSATDAGFLAAARDRDPGAVPEP